MEHTEYIKRLKEFGTVTIQDNGTIEFHMNKNEVFSSCILGCGATIPNQEIMDRQYQKPIPHTRQKCLFCYRWALPDGRFSNDHTVITNAFDKSVRREAKNARIKYSDS